MTAPPHRAHLSYEVPYADTDRMGVVYYANYLVYFERARSQLMKDLGYPYPELEKDGFALPVLEAHVDYRTGATYGDVLDLCAWTDWTEGVRIQVRCEVRREGKLLAAGYTIHACLALTTGRPVRLPARLAAACCPPSADKSGDSA